MVWMMSAPSRLTLLQFGQLGTPEQSSGDCCLCQFRFESFGLRQSRVVFGESVVLSNA